MESIAFERFPRLATFEARTPLSNPDAEEYVLAAMLLDSSAVNAIRQVLSCKDFTHLGRAALFSAMLALAEREEPVDQLSARDELERRGDLESVGGAQVIAELVDAVPVIANFKYHANAVRELAQRRALCDTMSEIARQVTDGAVPLTSAIADGTSRLTRLGGYVDQHEHHGFLTADEVTRIVPPTFLVAGLIQANSLALIVGKYGSGKSFLALNLALDVASGLPFLGRPVIPGPVLYVAAEGAGAFQIRMEAWRRARHVRAFPEFYCEPASVQLLERAAVSAFIARVKRLPAPPALIVLDTFARCTVGADENAVRDMGQAMESAAQIQREIGAAVVIVHHVGTNGNLRGSTAIPSAADTVILVEKTERGRLRLVVNKQKDGEDGQIIEAALFPIASSCSVALNEQREQRDDLPSDRHRQLLVALSDFEHAGGAPATKWQESSNTVSSATFYRTRKELVDWGYVSLDKKGKGGRYTLALAGKLFLAPTLSILSHEKVESEGPFTPSAAPFLKGRQDDSAQ